MIYSLSQWLGCHFSKGNNFNTCICFPCLLMLSSIGSSLKEKNLLSFESKFFSSRDVPMRK